MNPYATNLRWQRKSAEKVYKLAIASGNPKAILAAKVNLLNVTSLQTAFRKQQLQVLQVLNANILQTKNQIQGALNTEDLSGVQIQIPALQVKTHPINSPSPNYTTKNSFSKKQTGFAKWKTHSLGWVRGFDLSCAVTLKEEKEKWEVTLVGMDKL